MLGVSATLAVQLGLSVGVVARADEEPAGRELMRTEKQIQANLQSDRDLANNRIDVSVSDAVMPRIPHDIVAVSESGLKTAEDVIRLRRLGYDAFLVGERFMTAEDPGAALKALLDESSTTKETKDTEVRK